MSETTAKRLLTETNLTFSGAIDIGQGIETAAQNARKLQSTKVTSKSEADVYKLTPGQGEINNVTSVGSIYTDPLTAPTRMPNATNVVNKAT